METCSFHVFIQMFDILVAKFKLFYRQRQFYYTEQCYMFRSIRPSSCMDVHTLKSSYTWRWSHRNKHVILLNIINLSLIVHIYIYYIQYYYWFIKVEWYEYHQSISKFCPLMDKDGTVHCVMVKGRIRRYHLVKNNGRHWVKAKHTKKKSFFNLKYPFHYFHVITTSYVIYVVWRK
jgi:hypothetical protein